VKRDTPKQTIYGIHAVEEAIRAGKRFERIYILNERKNDALQALFQLVRTSKLPYHTVPIHKLNRLTRKNHQGVYAFLEVVPNVDIDEVISRCYEEGETPKILALDGVQDVRNFGALCRSAAAFGFHAVVIPQKKSVMVHEDAVKTSAGTIFNLHVCRVPGLLNTLKHLKDQGFYIVGVTEKKEHKLKEEKVEDPIVLVLGNEEIGIGEDVLHVCKGFIHIPINEEVDSLNVSVAGGIAMYQITSASKNQS
jgi:23S rRNA (guanosine2251-2'-O)-methyltransferase